MKLSREQAARNHERIVGVAGRLFRERGVDGVGVADLMKAAGFTHGGFYNHFTSKDALAAEACGAAFDHAVGRMNKLIAAGGPPGADALSHYAERYLSTAHRDDASGGCPAAGLATDAARQSADVQARFAAGIEAMLGILTAHLSTAEPPDARPAPPVARVRAVRLLSELAGALMLSRAVAKGDPALSEELLHASRVARQRPAPAATRRPRVAARSQRKRS